MPTDVHRHLGISEKSLVDVVDLSDQKQALLACCL